MRFRTHELADQWKRKRKREKIRIMKAEKVDAGWTQVGGGEELKGTKRERRFEGSYKELTLDKRSRFQRGRRDAGRKVEKRVAGGDKEEPLNEKIRRK